MVLMPDGAVLAVLDGVLERVTFANPETGYTIARIAPERGSGVGAEVDGLGPKRTAMVAAAWAEQKAIKEVMIFLQGVGVSTSLAVRIYKKYGDASVSVVRSEPYRLAADVWGIGFKTADTIAASVGIARDSPERIKAGLAYTLSRRPTTATTTSPPPTWSRTPRRSSTCRRGSLLRAWTSWLRLRGWCAGRFPPHPVRPDRRCPPSTCRLSLAQNSQ